ncbi:MAG: phoR2, partial [Elusimicrobia bacterium]
WAAGRRRRRRALAGLESAVSAMAAGDLVVRADGEGVGELSRLVSGVNMLAGRTAETFAQLGGDKARLRAVLDNMVEGVAIVSSDGRVQDVNSAMERLLGVRSAAARGLTVSEVFRHAPLQDLARRALETREPQSGEASLFVPEERVFSVSATALPGETRPAGAVLVLHDITRLRKLEELRKEFVANVSHELRTPLASIKSFAETLRLGALDDKEVRLEFVSTIEEQADRLTAIVDDLLELAALEGGRRPLKAEDLDLAAAVKKVLASLKPLAESARVSLVCSVPEGLRARADAGALERVLRNLVENAVKYNREDGRVELSACVEGEAVRVSVSDTGLGIPAADLPRVFERFYRVDKARSREKGGTGLGLSIVKHLVDGLGGAVRAESTEGRGSVFSFTLPSV